MSQPPQSNTEQTYSITHITLEVIDCFDYSLVDEWHDDILGTADTKQLLNGDVSVKGAA